MNSNNFFISYLLHPIIVAVTSFFLVFLNKRKEFISTLKLILFILISSLVVALPGLFGFFNLLFIPLLYVVCQFVFIVIGYFYMKNTIHYFSGKDEVFNRLMTALSLIAVLSLGSFLFSIIFNFLGGLRYGLMASSCTYTLALPILFRWTYVALTNIPSEIYKIWKYRPEYREPDFTSEMIDKIMVLELEMTKAPEDNAIVKVRAKAPVTFIFGDWFQMFLNDYNSKYFEYPIQYKNKKGEMYNWIFYVKPSFLSGKTYIDPEKSVNINKLSEKKTIVCKRVDKIH